MQTIDSEFQMINAQCSCFNMRKVARAVTQFYDRALEPIGVRATQFTLLVELSSVSAKTLTEIANGLVMDRTTLTRNLKPLEKQGWIMSTRPKDKRARGYLLTEQGRQVLDNALPLWKRAQNHVVEAMGAGRYQHMLGELNEMLKTMPQVTEKH